MESKTLLCIFILIATIAAIDAGSPALRDWEIGGSKGWTFGNNITETESASDFIYGDTLIFKYPVGTENVVEVDKQSYRTCTMPPNAKVYSSGHDVIQVDFRGERCYISGVENGSHCKGGLKICMIIPDSFKDCPYANPSKEYLVGDDKGWTTNIDYQAWAKDKEFNIKDKLVFKYPVGQHNVVEVDESGVNECKTPGGEVLAGAYTTGSDVVTLERVGGYGFISGIEKDCEMGMKLFINVTEKKPKLKGARKLVLSKE